MLIDDLPKGRNDFLFAIKEILEKPNFIQIWRIGITLPVVPEFGYPVVWLVWVHNIEQSRWIKIRATFVVQEPEIIGLDPDYDIPLARCQIGITRVFAPKLNDHSQVTFFLLISTIPILGCSYQ